MDMLEILGKVRKIEIGRAKKYMSVTNLPKSSLIDISSDLVLIFNSHLHLQYLNNSAARYFNTSLKVVIGERLENLHFSLLSGNEIYKLLSAFSFEKPEHITIQDNTGLWFEITILGFSLNQAFNQIAIICTDISEKKRSDEEVLTVQEKYSKAFLASPDGIIMSNLESGEIIEVNPAFCNLLGYSWVELMGKKAVELGILESEESRKFLIRNTKMNDFGRCCYDLKIQKQSGEIFDVSLSSSIIRMEGKECLLTVIRDISERKKNEELYHLLADNIRDVIWILDPYTESFIYISPSIFKLNGYYPDEIIGHSFSESLTPELYKFCSNEIRRFIHIYESGDDSVKHGQIVITIKHRDGHEVVVEIFVTFVAGPDRKVIYIVGVSRDITAAGRNIFPVVK